jgi:hypothetical protein
MVKHDIVPTHLVVKAMRDNGYRNAAYAIAELMDNAIQAKAKQIELLCCEEVEMLQERKRSRIKEIAVLDNGIGMDAKNLRRALQFGNGTHLTPEEQLGIGKFGMGLPSSSVSQCRRVDVWSWQNGIENAFFSYLDLDEIESGRLIEVPEPISKNVPNRWLEIGDSFSGSGTLVVWSKIDKCLWRTAQTIIDNSELLIGRMYRYFLSDNRTIIRLVSFDGNTKKISINRYAEPNDPCYMMKNTSCPPPFNNEEMFQTWGEQMQKQIKFRGKDHPVKITFSIAKEKSRVGFGARNPGDLPHGKHAARNLGVSIVRAERELDLDTTWSNQYDTTDRWWGVEVSFEPALDELFGVTNNKQSARNFSELAKTDLESLLDENQSLEITEDILSADEDPRLPLWQIANHIRKNILSMKALIKTQTEGTRSKKRYDTQPEKKATDVTRQRQEEGHTGESDSQENNSPEERKDEIAQELINEGVAQTTAEELAAKTVDEGYKYTFSKANVNSPAFFDVQSRGGSMIVSLNVNHPAYSHLIEVLDEEVEEMKLEEIRGKFNRAKDGLKLLLMAWARYEDEALDGTQKNNARDARWKWGRIAEDFMNER